MTGRLPTIGGALVAVALIAGTGCGDRADDGAPEVGLTATVLQYREDEVVNQMQLKVVNHRADTVRIGTLTLSWPGLAATEPRIHDYPIGPGGRVDLAIPVGRAVCSDPPAFDDRAPDAPISAVATIGGEEVRFPVTDDGAVLARIYAAGCLRQAIEHRVGLAWDRSFVVAGADPPTLTGTLRITRRDTDQPIEVVDLAGTVVVNVDAALPATVAAGSDSGEVAATFTNNRCDAHALSEVKKPFEFLVTVTIDGRREGYVVAPDPEGKAQLFTGLLRRCPPDAVP